MYKVLRKGSRLEVCDVRTVDEALIAEASGMVVEPIGRLSIDALAAARVEASPEYNQLPTEDERWVMYTSLANRQGVYEVIRLFSPGSDGSPQFAELVGRNRPDSSFTAPTDRVKVLERGDMSDALWDAITAGNDGAEPANSDRPKLTKGLRR